jgi:haloacid dehalogenase-like hydrolase
MHLPADLELLAYLRANGFKTYIVSGGGLEFMRPCTEKAYGVPPEQIIGSTMKTKFELRDDRPVLVRLGELDSLDDETGKPINITKSLAVVRLPLSVTPMAICRCCNGPRPARVRD